jgi:hypothetical protein
MIRRLIPIGFCLLSLPGIVRADKIIMKDGKIFEGRIMGETTRSVLISNPPRDPKPRFIELRDVFTIVRESHPSEAPSPEEGRFASVTMGLSGQVYSSNELSLSPAPGVYWGGAFRIFPLLEIGGEFDFIPHLTGDLAVQDRQALRLREYESFYAYHGGFSVKIFPFSKRRSWRWEPYGIAGYHWNRLVPKASGDSLKGSSLFGGAGVMIPWWKPLYWDLRFLYEATQYDSIEYLGREGDLSGVAHKSYSFSAGLSYRFL